MVVLFSAVMIAASKKFSLFLGNDFLCLHSPIAHGGVEINSAQCGQLAIGAVRQLRLKMTDALNIAVHFFGQLLISLDKIIEM